MQSARADRESDREASWKDPVPAVKVARRRFAKGWNGVPVHYTCYGQGEPTIVCCNGIGVSTFFWKYVVRYFAGTHRVITWDYRGHNGSGVPEEMIHENFTMSANAHDLAAVLDDCGVDRAVALGHSMGCQVLFEFWRLHPTRVAGLIPICGAYGSPVDTVLNTPIPVHAIFDAVTNAVTAYPRVAEMLVRPLLRSRLPFQVARLGAINAQLADIDDMGPYFDHLSEMNLEVFFLMAHEMQRHSAKAWLHKIDAPTLVVGGEHDLLSPLSLSTEMQDRIPDAELLILPKGSHAGLIEHPELMNLRIEKFLRERVEPFLAGVSKKGSRKGARSRRPKDPA